jgi:hypothetical protein
VATTFVLLDKGTVAPPAPPAASAAPAKPGGRP